jgi:hypothetical protein
MPSSRLVPARSLAALRFLTLGSQARAHLLDESRRTSPQALAVNVQRHVLPNGLVVLPRRTRR